MIPVNRHPVFLSRIDQRFFPNGFTPVNISGLIQWNRSDLGITLNGSNVSGWADQSGNGNHWIQSTALNQPLYVANAINGKPALSFNGTSHHMISDSVASVFNGTDKPYTYFCVFEKAITPGTEAMIGVGNSISATPFIRHSIEPSGVDDRIDSAIRDDAALTTTVNSNVFTRANPHFITIICNGTSLQFYVDGGIDLLQPFDVGAITLDRFTLGALRRRDVDAIINYFNGFIGESILYNRALNLNEFTQLHSYISA